MIPRSLPPVDAGLLRRTAELIVALNYEGDPAYFTPERLADVPNYRHSLQRAFDVMRVVGCFGFLSRNGAGRGRFTPALYVAPCANQDAADEVHKMAWSQGVVPLLLVTLPRGVQLREASSFDRSSPIETIPWEAACASGVLDRRLASLQALRLRGSVAWKDYSPRDANRVDARLTRSIEALSTFVRTKSPQLAGRPDLVNALIGQFIYLFVLVDRGTIDQEWVDGLRHDDESACPRIRLDDERSDARWPASETWRLLDALDEVLNGSVFPVTDGDRRLVDEDTLHDVRRVIRKGDVLEQGERQLSFLDVSFATLRTETISAMYELFLKLEGPGRQDKDGAFYTPPFVADYMLDELEGMAPLGGNSRVFDPAAGSGIFLVGSFRRIAEASTPAGGWTVKSLLDLRTLLSTCIFGVERNQQAVNVARFSLYLTLLDYADGAPLSAITAALGEERLFPPMIENIACRDYFEAPPAGRQPAASFTHVVGNPPWGKLKDGEWLAKDYLADLDRSKQPVDYDRVEEIFFWKVLSEAVVPGGAVALLLSTRCFTSANAKRFPAALARNAAIVGVTNLSHFRYRLFENVRSPATAVFALAREAADLQPAWVYSPLLTTQPISTRGHPWSIVTSPSNLTYVRHAELRTSSWSRILLLQPFDRRNAGIVVDGAAARGADLGTFLKRAGMLAQRGGTPEQTGLPTEMILGGDKNKPNYYRSVLGLERRDVGQKQASLPLGQRSYKLLPTTVRQARRPYDRLFAGDMLVVSRHMAHFDVITRPAAFNSTLNLMAFRDECAAGDVPRRRSTLSAMARFFASNLARYLYTLVGRSWALDARRFEVEDLVALPFPFKDVDDLLEAGDQDFADCFRERLGLDASFTDTVAQYASYRSGYKDSKVPANAQSEPDETVRGKYFRALEAELRAAFGPLAEFSLEPVEVGAGDLELITMALGLKGQVGGAATTKMDAHPAEEPSHATFVGFDAGCAVWYDRATSTVRLLKPRTLAAWTLDRAYADRLAIVEEITRS